MLHKHLEQQGVSLRLGDGVDAFEHTDETVTVRLKSGRTVTADLVILSIGVRPNSKLAKDAGLELNARGGIVTDQFLRTSDPAIYAVGDAIEVQDFISGERTMIPLAGPANKQGRIAADLSLIHISEPTRQAEISYAVFCLKNKTEPTRKAEISHAVFCLQKKRTPNSYAVFCLKKT